MDAKSITVRSAGLKVGVMDDADDASPSGKVWIVVSRKGRECIRIEIDGDVAQVEYARPFTVHKRRK